MKQPGPKSFVALAFWNSLPIPGFPHTTMAIEQQATLQEAEAAIKAGRNSEGERILKQILQLEDGERF